MPSTAEIDAALRQIREDNGGVLTAAAIVEAAAAPEHILHSHFEWNAEEAAAKYRLQQARQLVRVVRLTYINKRGEPEQIRAWHSVPSPQSPTGRAYTPLAEIQESEFLTKELKRSMEIEWRALQRRYRRFSEFTAIVARDLGLREPTGTEPLALGDEASADA